MTQGQTNPTWRNHYLPQAYLCHFCDASGRVLRTFHGPDGKLHQKRFVPKATGYEEDLYSFRSEGLDSPTTDSDYIERKVLGPIDDLGIKAVRKVIDVGPSDLSSDERVHLSLLLNSFLERHPQRLRAGDEKAILISRRTVEALRREWGTLPDDRSDVFDRIDPDAMARNVLRRHMMEQISEPRVINYISGFAFIRVQVDPNPVLQFVTGDRPVLVNLGQPGPIHWLTLSLDPQNLLVGHGLSEPLEDVDLLFRLALVHNIQLFRQCEYVFSRDALEDTGALNTRTAGNLSLNQVSWRVAQSKPVK